AIAFGIAGGPAHLDVQVAAVHPAQLLEPLPERRNVPLSGRLAFREMDEHSNAADALALLRPCRERPRDRGAARGGPPFPPSDGAGNPPLPREVRRGKDTTPRACSLHVRGGRMLVASTSVSGFNCTTPAASSSRTRHRGLARHLVAVHRLTIFVAQDGPEPWRSKRGRCCFQDA